MKSKVGTLAATVCAAVVALGTVPATAAENATTTQGHDAQEIQRGPVTDALNQARAQLSSVGIESPELPTDVLVEADRVVTDVQNRIQDAVNQSRVQFESLGEASKHVTDPLLNYPNYTWTNDPVSQVLAGKAPGSGPVLHRAPGSYYDAPRVPQESVAAERQGKALFGAGTPIYLGKHSLCTLTAVGTDAQGRKVGLTVGHCGTVGQEVRSADAVNVGPAGTVVRGGSGAPFSVIEFGSNTVLTDNYNGVKVDGVGGAATTGDRVCKFGVATGWTCGYTLLGSGLQSTSHMAAMQGDSGAPVMRGTNVVGVVDGGLWANPALVSRSPLQGVFHMPVVSFAMDNVIRQLNQGDATAVGYGFTPYVQK